MLGCHNWGRRFDAAHVLHTFSNYFDHVRLMCHTWDCGSTPLQALRIDSHAVSVFVEAELLGSMVVWFKCDCDVEAWLKTASALGQGSGSFRAHLLRLRASVLFQVSKLAQLGMQQAKVSAGMLG